MALLPAVEIDPDFSSALPIEVGPDHVTNAAASKPGGDQ
jgi:hypothetical protein